MALGTKVKGEIETFTVTVRNDDNDTFILKGEDGQTWFVRGYNIGSTKEGFVIGEEVYDHPV